MKIAIVEDTEEDFSDLKKQLNDYAIDHQLSFELTRYQDALMFLSEYSMQYDCVFMDIMAPGANGMDETKKLRTFDPQLPVIFVTRLEQYAVQGYSVDAFDYIVKPINRERMIRVMDRLRERMESKHQKTIFVKGSDSVIRIPIELLYYVAVNGHKVCYHTSFGCFETWDSMKEVEKTLQGCDFIRISSGYLVNMQYITYIRGMDLSVGQDILPISRRKKTEVLDQINRYLSSNHIYLRSR